MAAPPSPRPLHGSSRQRGYRWRWTAQVFYLISFATGLFFMTTMHISVRHMKIMQSSSFRHPFWLPEVQVHDNLRSKSTITTKKDPFIATAIIVETRCHSALSVVLLGAVRNLGPEVLIVVMHSSQNELFIRGVIQSFPVLMEWFQGDRLVLHQIRETKWGLKFPLKGQEKNWIKIPFKYSPDYWYSKMFVNVAFWAQFETPYVLTLQSDTLLCRSFPTKDLIKQNVSFTGGASDMTSVGNSNKWKNYIVPPDPEWNSTLRREHLNGGMSLRNIQWVTSCIKKYGGKGGGWAEDSLYRFCRTNDILGTVHETQIGAYTFSSDNGHTMCFTSPSGERICPLGVHKPWSRGAKKPNQYMELKRNCKGLAALQTLVGYGVQDRQTCQAFDMEGVNVSTFRCNCTF